MKRTTLAKYLLSLALAIAPIKLSAPNIPNFMEEKIKDYEQMVEREKEKVKFEKYVTTTDSLIQNAPRYRRLVDDCSQYTRRAANELFGIKYSWAHAWDRPKIENSLYKFESKKFDYEGKIIELDSLFKKGVLERGVIFGFYNSKSKYNSKKRAYTHVNLFAGVDKAGEYWVLENRGRHQGATSLKELNRQGYDLREILIENKSFMEEHGPKD